MEEEKSNLKLIGIYNSTTRRYRFVAIFNDNSYTNFGDRDWISYVQHQDENKRKNYIKRTRKYDLRDPKSSQALSRYILYNLPNIDDAIADYRAHYSV